jgi:Uma2 family endonuclease
MNGIDVQALPPGQRGEVFYPTSDGQPMAETGIHVRLMVDLIVTLRQYYRERQDVYVIGNIFLYYREGHPEARRSPDVMVIKGVDKTERRSFKTWEEKAMPCVMIELTSGQTAKEDQEDKKQLYQELGVREYFLFDPLHDYLPQPLIGYRLIGGEYEPLIPAADGGVLSAELGLRLVPEGEQLALIHFASGARLPVPAEAYQLLDESREQIRLAEERISQAEERARQAEEQARQQAEEQARQVEGHVRQVEERARQAEERVRFVEEQQEKQRQQIEEFQAELARLRAQLQPPAPPEGQGGV